MTSPTKCSRCQEPAEEGYRMCAYHREWVKEQRKGWPSGATQKNPNPIPRRVTRTPTLSADARASFTFEEKDNGWHLAIVAVNGFQASGQFRSFKEAAEWGKTQLPYVE